MQPESEKLLQDMILAADLVAEFVETMSERDYLASTLHRSAVERQLFIVGEALSQLSRVDPETFEAIPGARRIVSFRNVLAHGYAQIDDARVWDILQNDLQATIADVNKLLARP